MTEQRHRIRRQVIELKVPDEDTARRVQSALSRIQRRDLERIIDQCCSELSAPDRLHRIDSLEVDLGVVDLRDLERELGDKLQAGLHKALAASIEKQDGEAVRRAQNPAMASQLELVAYFADTGILPWWADSSNPRLPAETIVSLTRLAPARLAALIRDVLARHRAQLRRIVIHCDDRILCELFDALLSTAGLPVADRREELDTLLKAWPAAPVDRSRLRNVFWPALLRLAVSETKASPTSDAFWPIVLAEVEAVSKEAYLSLWNSLAARLRSGTSPDLKPLLQDLVAHSGGLDSLKLPPGAQSELARLLADGRDRTSIPRLPAEEGDRAPGPRVRSRQPQQPGTESLPGAFRRPGESILHPFRNAAAGDSLDLAFGDADAVYIENSGLVILWPFLARFFERLELMEGDAFHDEPARHRAAALLQHLVTGDTTPPEYQMTLDKVLCGVDPNELLDFGPPVTEAESEECANLLTAAIGHAPILRDMSIDGFRGSFLLRKGVLSARDGRWLLQVERQTFDVVLDRFPWSFNWVKLPWMETPLGVEW